MKAPRGFGKGYFSLVAIQAYASFVKLLQSITRIVWICPTHPIHTYSTVSPPAGVLSLSLTIFLFQGHPCAQLSVLSSLPRQLLPR